MTVRPTPQSARDPPAIDAPSQQGILDIDSRVDDRTRDVARDARDLDPNGAIGEIPPTSESLARRLDHLVLGRHVHAVGAARVLAERMLGKARMTRTIPAHGVDTEPPVEIAVK